jgi:hypothetical protein
MIAKVSKLAMISRWTHTGRRETAKTDQGLTSEERAFQIGSECFQWWLRYTYWLPVCCYDTSGGEIYSPARYA